MIDSLLGGVLIGLAASGMLWANGRVMGVSGIVAGILQPKKAEIYWRVLFLLGLFVGGAISVPLGYSVIELPFDRGLFSAAIGGLLVGLGTILGNGCTSGHGVCGVSRMSPRSIVATATFIISGIITVWLFSVFSGGHQ